MTDREGRFQVSPLIEVSYRAYAGLHKGERLGASMPCVPLVRPGPEEVEVSVPDANPRGYFLGTLLDSAGAPVGGAWIQIVQKGVFRFFAATKTEPGSGSFRVGPLPEGKYELILDYDADERPPLHLKGLTLARAEEKDLGVLRFPVCGRLTVTARFADGSVPEQASAEINPDEDSEPERHSVSLKAGTGSKALPVGRYRAIVFGTGFGWQEKVFSIEAGKESRIDVLLERGVQRQLVFPVPEPPGWESTKSFRIEIRRTDGGVTIKEDFDQESLWPFTYWPCLTPGRYRMSLWVEDGAAMHGEFTVDGVERTLRPIEVRLQ